MSKKDKKELEVELAKKRRSDERLAACLRHATHEAAIAAMAGGFGKPWTIAEEFIAEGQERGWLAPWPAGVNRTAFDFSPEHGTGDEPAPPDDFSPADDDMGDDMDRRREEAD